MRASVNSFRSERAVAFKCDEIVRAGETPALLIGQALAGGFEAPGEQKQA